MLLLLLACSEAPTPDATTGSAVAPAVPVPLETVSVALNWYPEPEFGGYYEALLSGAYTRAGLDVKLIPGGPGVPAIEMLASTEVEVAISGADDLLVRRSRGFDGIAVLPGFQDSPIGLMARAEGGPKSFAEVKGRVATEAGSPFQQFLWGKFGWEGKVEMVPTTGSIAAFANDPKLIQQAYITSEPCLAEGQGLAVVFLPGREAGWNPYSSLAVVRGADKAEPWVKSFHDASLEGWKSYLADPSRANAEITRLNPNLPADRMNCIVNRQAPYVRGKDGVGKMTAARWEETAAALRSVGVQVDAAGAYIDLGG